MAQTLLNRSDIHPDRPCRTAVAPRRGAGGDRDEQVPFGGEDRAPEAQRAAHVEGAAVARPIVHVVGGHGEQIAAPPALDVHDPQQLTGLKRQASETVSPGFGKRSNGTGMSSPANRF